MRITKGLQSVNRLRRIVEVATVRGFGFLLTSAELRQFIPFHKRVLVRKTDSARGPEALKRALEDLGGAFVKLGQILSLRPDLIPVDYSEELAKLQDNVKPMDFGLVKKTIESELHKPLDKVFRRIDEQPVGSGSIAQVHHAELVDGTTVAVKVQRPHIKDIFERDIYLMRKLARLLQDSGKFPHLDFTAIVNEFEQYSRNELNFFREVKNITRSYENFKDTPSVKIPKAYLEYCTERLIVMDFIDGIKLSDVRKARFDKKKVAQRLIEIYLKQTLDDGFFHADLHPGNILVCGEDCVALLDFGIFSHLDHNLKIYLTRFLGAVMEGDVHHISDIIQQGFDSGVTKVSPIFTEELEDVVIEWRAQKSKRRGFTELLMQILNLCAKHGIKIPESMVLFSKGLFTIEGTCQALNPELNFIEDLRPYFEGLLKQKSPKEMVRRIGRIFNNLQHWAEEIPEKAERIMNQLEKGLLRISFEVDHKEFDELKSSINRVGNRMIWGNICAALIIASGLLINVGTARIFGISWFSAAGFVLAAVLAIFLIKGS